ncbi:MAG: DNA recombination/repair protein RecA, partial [Pyramidobacter sp.]|nr:DNA recombination/repair protein RecA [Pyramidobacter sp.]
PDVLAEIRQAVLDEAAQGLGILAKPEEAEDAPAADVSDSGVNIEEGVIELDIGAETAADDSKKK